MTNNLFFSNLNLQPDGLLEEERGNGFYQPLSRADTMILEFSSLLLCAIDFMLLELR